LINTCQYEIALAGVVSNLMLQLQNVEQFILNIAKVAADNLSGLFVRNNFTQPEIVQ
jgi:hypothetical protein